MTLRRISIATARRLALAKQRLDGSASGLAQGPSRLLELVRELGCLQIDPISAVAPTQLLVPWSRLGVYDRNDLDHLLWRDRSLFHYFAHAASIVPTDDYPIHRLMMRTWPTGDGAQRRRARAWLEENKALRRHVLVELRRRGLLASRQFEDRSTRAWSSGGWNDERNVNRMLDFLWVKGKVMVAGRRGGQRLWTLSETWFPEWTPRKPLSEREVVRRCAQRSLRALGVATPKQLTEHFTRYRYPGLASVLSQLERKGSIERVDVADDGQILPGDWYVHTADLPLVDSIEAGSFGGRTTLLSPFDNLVCDRARTLLLFGFDYRTEFYVPKDKRRYGYYVMPILWRDRLIGRVDPLMDRNRGRLSIVSVHAEPEAPKAAGKEVAGAIESLAAFLGATGIDYGRVPALWRASLR